MIVADLNLMFQYSLRLSLHHIVSLMIFLKLRDLPLITGIAVFKKVIMS